MNQFTSVKSYINSFDGKTKEYLHKVRSIILDIVPESEELINYNIAGFTLIEGGKREQQIMIAGYKKHIGFYPHPTTMEFFWEELEGFKKAKGSVQFPLSKPLPEVLIKKMVEYCKNLIDSE